MDKVDDSMYVLVLTIQDVLELISVNTVLIGNIIQKSHTTGLIGFLFCDKADILGGLILRTILIVVGFFCFGIEGGLGTSK